MKTKHLIATVSTSNYLRHTKRLLRSLQRTGMEFELIVYCDDLLTFRPMEAMGQCRVVELPAIRSHGVMRAKFDAYVRTIKESDFLFLDSDIFVLKDLSGLFGHEKMTACADDLSTCHFIPDKTKPWSKAPSLENRVYINSGIMYFPKADATRLQKAYKESLNEETWTKFGEADRLHDNHFLCAYLNLWNWPIELVDAELYNWQGFYPYPKGPLNVFRSHDGLVNRTNNKELHLVHLAGVRTIDDYLKGLPLPVASLLADLGYSDEDEPENEDFALFKKADAYFRRGGRVFSRMERHSRQELASMAGHFTIASATTKLQLELGSSTKLRVAIRNETAKALVPSADLRVRLAYRWARPDGTLAVKDGPRTQLLPIAPYAECTEVLHVQAPSAAGAHVLQVSLVLEGAYWFHEKSQQCLLEIQANIVDPLRKRNRLKETIVDLLDFDFVDKFPLRKQLANGVPHGLHEPVREQQILVALTSTPAQMENVDLCVLSLLSQVEKPDQVILFLSQEDFPQGESDLPERLLKLRAAGLSLRWTTTAALPVSPFRVWETDPNCVLIRVEEGVFYGPDLVGSLVDSYLQAPNEVHYRKSRPVDPLKEQPLPPLPLAACGVLYPPQSLDNTVVDEVLYHASEADGDLWSWAMTLLKGTTARLAGSGQIRVRYLNLEDTVSFHSMGSRSGVLSSASEFAKRVQKQIEAIPRLRKSR